MNTPLFVSVTFIVPAPRVVPLISTVSLSIVTPFNPTTSEEPEAEVSTVPILPNWLRLTVNVILAARLTVVTFENAKPVADRSTLLPVTANVDAPSPVIVPVNAANCVSLIVTVDEDPVSITKFAKLEMVALDRSTVPTVCRVSVPVSPFRDMLPVNAPIDPPSATIISRSSPAPPVNVWLDASANFKTTVSLPFAPVNVTCVPEPYCEKSITADTPV